MENAFADALQNWIWIGIHTDVGEKVLNSMT